MDPTSDNPPIGGMGPAEERERRGGRGVGGVCGAHCCQLPVAVELHPGHRHPSPHPKGMPGADELFTERGSQVVHPEVDGAHPTEGGHRLLHRDDVSRRHDGVGSHHAAHRVEGCRDDPPVEVAASEVADEVGPLGEAELDALGVEAGQFETERAVEGDGRLDLREGGEGAAEVERQVGKNGRSAFQVGGSPQRSA